MDDQNPILDSPILEGKEPAKNSFVRGVLYVIAFYGTSSALAGLSYLMVGHPYAHAPGLHHIILFFTFAGGFFWTLFAGIIALTGNRSAKLKGILLTNTVALLGVAWFMYTIVYEKSEIVQDSTKEMTMTHKGDTAILYDDNNIIYMRVKDSVLINFFDSAKVNE